MESQLTGGEWQRYARHLVLPEVGPAGQERLKRARVLLVGVGGLGSPAALYLAAAGVGTLGLVDDDVVDESNLQRQVLHGTGALGRPKLESARARLHELNPHVALEAHAVRLSAANALEILGGYDVVLDGTDNFATRYLVNDACVRLGKPNVHGAVYRFEGQASVFWAERGPCYRCLFPEPPAPGSTQSCAEAGVLGVLPGIIGSLQALEAIKLLLGIGEPLIGRLLLFDGLAGHFREVRLRRNPECPACGAQPRLQALEDHDGGHCGRPPTRREERATMFSVPEITATELHQRLQRGDKLALIDVREPSEWEYCNLEDHGARLIPLGELPTRLDELNPDHEVVLQCRSGSRSASAVRYLQAQGFARVWNLRGGILAWSDEVDPSIPKY